YVLRGLEGALHHASWGLENFASYAVTAAVDGLGTGTVENLVYLFAMIKLGTTMIWMITVSTNIDMSIAWHRFLAFPNIWFKRNAHGATALGGLQPMTSGGKQIDFETVFE
ncbi:Fe-S oxidoreductase, partial [Streptomyces chumphonensis]|nr:Fe-S oxidoreductase [Streptomyces chumphonensis]